MARTQHIEKSLSLRQRMKVTSSPHRVSRAGLRMKIQHSQLLQAIPNLPLQEQDSLFSLKCARNIPLQKAVSSSFHPLPKAQLLAVVYHPTQGRTGRPDTALSHGLQKSVQTEGRENTIPTRHSSRFFQKYFKSKYPDNFFV